MKKQKPSRLFRALIVSSTLSGLASRALAQEDGVANANPQPGGDGVVNLGQPAPELMPSAPNYNLPQYAPQFGGDGTEWFNNNGGHGNDGRNRIWQDDIGPRFRLETRIGEWLGSEDDGSAGVSAMIPFRLPDSNFVMFVDGRGASTYAGTGYANIGAGLRYFDQHQDRVYGLSGWYDYDNGNQKAYHQAGVSLETMGRYFDLRANAYLPVTTDNYVVSTSLGALRPGGFGLVRDQNNLVESTYAGFNIEAGGPLPLLGRYGFEGYVGGYYFQNDDDEIVSGPSVRLEANVTDDLLLGINVTNDNVFQTQVFGTVSLTLPDGRPQKYFRLRTPEERLLSRVERRYRTVTNRRVKTTTVNALSTAFAPGAGGGNNGLNISNIIFVNPNAAVNGIGTFENPLQTLVGFGQAPVNSLFLVADGNLNGTVRLLDDSKIFSNNYVNSHPVLINTPAGPIAIPTIASTQQPVWSNPTGGPLITLNGNNTEVAGFTFDGKTNAGVPNSDIIVGGNIAGFSIHDNTFRNYTNAITLSNATGTIAAGNPGLVFSNQFFGQSGISQRAFDLTNNGVGTLDLEFGATPFAITSSKGLALGNFAYGNTGEDANGNGILDAGEDTNGNGGLDGGVAFAVTARNQAIINANVIGNATAGEDLDRNGVLLTEDLNRNGMLDLGEDTNLNGKLDFGEDQNRNGRLDFGNSQGFVFTAGASQSVINLRMVDNIIGDNVRDGVVLASNSSTINAGTLGEDVNGNGRLDGNEDRNGNNRLDPAEDRNGNNLIDPGEDINMNGILDPSEDTNLNGRFDRGEDGNEDRDNDGILDPGEDLNADGFLNRGNQNGLLDGGFIITDNQIIRNGGDGLRVDITNNGSVSLRLTNNQIGLAANRSTGNRGIGFNANADSGSLLVDLGYVYNEDANFNGLLDIGEDGNGNNRLDVPLAADANDIVGNFGGGVSLNLTGTAEGTFNAIGNTIDGIGGGVLGFLVTGDTTGQNLTFANNSVTGLDLSRIQWNIAAANLQFNTIAATNGTPFQVTNNSGTTTGLQSVNGTTSPAFAIQTLATNLDLVFNSFNTANGILDTGEDLNANNMLDAGEDLPDQFVFLTDLDQAGFNPSIVFGNQLIGSTITAAFASGQVVTGTMQAVPGQATASQFVATSTNNGLGNGVAIRAGNESRLRNSVILNNSISQHGGTGLLLQSSESGVIENVLVRGNSILSNGAGTGLSAFGSGIALRTLNNVNAQLNASLINNVISNNSGGAIDASAAGGLMNLARILNNTLDSNGSGISLSATQAGTLAAQLTNNQITNSRRVIAANTSIRSTGDGVIVVADAGTVQLNEIAFNTITGSGGNGLNFSATNAGVIRVTPSEDFNQNGVLDPGEDANEDLDNDGIRDLNEPDSNSDGFLNRGNGNGQLDRGILGNSLTNNAGLAFGVTTTGGTVDLSDVRNTSVVTNTIGTGNFSLVGTNGVLRANFLGNTVLGNATPTGGPGLIVSATGGSFVVNVGGPNAGDGNTFSGNSGAGVAFALSDTGTGSFVIENNTITRIIDDANPVTPFNGDGISVSLVGSTNIVDATAVLTRSDIRGNIIGDLTNANLGLNGSGIAVLASENTTIQDLLIEGNTIGRAGNDNVLLVPSVGGPITGNDDAGIEFDRADDARFDVVNPRPGQTQAVTVRNNIVRNNVGANGISPVDGLNINVMNGIKDDIDFDIRNNQFGGNTGNGLRFTTQADASLATNLTANLIEDNILNGIQMDGVENVANDFETQGGTWIKNTIRNNRRNGIQIFSVSGDIVPLIIGQVGIDPLDGVSLGNTIENNGLSGITISGGGFSQMNNNLIQRNGLHGININADNIGFRADTLRNNRILSNAGDGLQFRNRSGIGGLGYLLAFGNSIDGNAGRGVDILSQGIATSNIRFGNDTAAGANSITSNGLEAFYVVNTASFSQNNTDDSSVPLQADGSVGASQANMVLDVSRNFINSNNNTGDFIGGGLVIRAGTNFGGSGPFTIADPTGTSGGTTAVGTNSSTFGNGRINARVINNELQGNLGDDVYIESFTSTVDPVVSAGTWDAMVFTVMAYQSDPLARLNLVFRGNVGNSINVTTGQFFASANPGQSPSVGAFYANGEADFKSRLNTATPGGPFAVADRRRNAQRIPYRDEGTTQLPPLPLNSPEFGFYQYPGMGASTFRVESDFDLSGFQNGDSFELDFLPNDPFPINGLQVPFVPPIRFGEQRFGWGAATPGTFQFDQAFAIPQLGTGTNQVQAPQANGELDGFVRPPELGN